MGKKLSPLDLELYQRTDEVLHYLWDPIGVAAEPMARDEYQAYLPQVFGLLKDNATEEKIAAYLETVATERMGFNASLKQSNHIASVLLEWKEVIAEKHTLSDGKHQ